MTVQKFLAVIRRFFVVKTDSWHYELLNSFADGNLEAKPSTYWLTQFPIAIVCDFAIKSFFAFFWFFGYSENKPGSIGFFLPYRMTATGKTKLFVPWEIAFMDLAAFGSAKYLFHWPPLLLLVLAWFLLFISIPLLFTVISPPPVKAKRLDL